MEVWASDPGHLVEELSCWKLKTPGAPSQTPEQGEGQGEGEWSTVKRQEQAHQVSIYMQEEPLEMASGC